MNSHKKEKLRRIPHIISGFLILLHGYERYDGGHHTYPVFFIAGTIFLAVATWHHSLLKKFLFIDVLFFFIEALLGIVIALEYFEQGKKGLPFVYLFASLLQLAAIFVFIKRKKRKQQTPF